MKDVVEHLTTFKLTSSVAKRQTWQGLLAKVSGRIERAACDWGHHLFVSHLCNIGQRYARAHSVANS